MDSTPVSDPVALTPITPAHSFTTPKESAEDKLIRLRAEEAQLQEQIDAARARVDAEENVDFAFPTIDDCQVKNSAHQAKWCGHLLNQYAGPIGKSGLSAKDWPATAKLAGTFVALEAVTFFTEGDKRVACSIPSILRWLKNRPLVIRTTRRLEDNYGDHFAKLYLDTRKLPAQDVLKMHGKHGLSVIVYAVFQWRSMEPEAHDWKHVVADMTDALTLLREKPDDLDFGLPLGDLLEVRNSARAKKVLKVLQKRSDARAQRRRGYARKCKAKTPSESSQRRSQRLRQGR